MKHKFGLLPKVLLAIALGIVFGLFVPEWFTRIALTFNNIFGNFLNFVIPLLILGLVAPGIADLGSKAGRLLVITAALAYAFTLFSGFGTFFTSFGILPRLLGGTEMSAPGETAATPMQPFFTVEMPPLMGVMTALILAFVLGLGMAYIHSDKLKGMMDDFKLIIERVISKVIIPLLPFYIFGIFLSMTQSGQVSGILGIFLKLIVIIFVMTVVLLLGITMIAAPGVPGGAIMAAIGLLESMLGFDENMIGLMIATYIAMDSFGTATNVTGDGAIAVIVNAIDSRMVRGEKR